MAAGSLNSTRYFACGQARRRRFQISTFAGVLSTITDFPLRWSSRCRMRSQSRCSSSSLSSPRSAITSALNSLAGVTCSVRRCISCGARICEWLFSRTRRSVDPARIGESTNTGSGTSRDERDATPARGAISSAASGRAGGRSAAARRRPRRRHPRAGGVANGAGSIMVGRSPSVAFAGTCHRYRAGGNGRRPPGGREPSTSWTDGLTPAETACDAGRCGVRLAA